jgi:hypothetical protein
VLCDAVPVLSIAVAMLCDPSFCCVLLQERDIRAQVFPCDVALPKLLSQGQTFRAVLELMKKPNYKRSGVLLGGTKHYY